MMQDFKGKHILLGVCGGIAAYKTAYLIRALIALGAEVQVVMTESAKSFITPMTLQALTGKPVRDALFDEAAEAAMGHIELAKWADYCVVAPATANTIAKLAHGLADDLLSTLALVLTCPLLVCPAMNQAMWHHAATQDNINTLKHRGAIIVGPGSGVQACGDEGLGRMVEVDTIVNALRLTFVHQLLADQHVLITAGPTREMIDPVRYISNRSSGKMGYALAHAALMAGAKVTLISGPSALTPPEGVNFIAAHSAQAMYDAVMLALTPGTIFIGAAAVCDYAPYEIYEHKLKKSGDSGCSLTLLQTQDILASVAASQRARYVMGFAAETNNVLQYAKQKLVKKKLDCIVANLVSDTKGFDVDTHELVVLTETKTQPLVKAHKVRLAGELVAILAANLQNDPHIFSEQEGLHETSYTT